MITQLRTDHRMDVRSYDARLSTAPAAATEGLVEIDLRDEVDRPPGELPEEEATPGQGGELLAEEADWWAHARCNDGSGRFSNLFFSEELHDIARAKHICATCPAMIPCLEGALHRREPWGVWGGQLFLNGKILATKRRRGRPPKVARPEDQLPEIPIPEHLRDRAVVRIA